MLYYDNCTVYHTGISKPHTLQIENRLISIVYYPVEYTENPVLYAECTDKQGNKYKVYSYEHTTWTGWLAFPNEPDKISGILY